MERTGPRVLVAEGDETLLLILQHILVRHGFAVDLARSAEEASAFLADVEYAAVIIDVKGPLRGTELILSLTSGQPEAARRIIALAAGSDGTHDIDGLPLHAIVRKPLELFEIVEVVRRCAAG